MTKLRLAAAAVFVVLGCDFEALRIEACFDAGLCNDAGVPIATGGSGVGGGSTAGGSTAGGSTAGGSTAGGSAAGGSTAGGSTAGGSAAGGSTAGGSTAGGSTAGGSTAGGSTAGGSTAGGSAAGGSAAGGSAAGGSTAGGNAQTLCLRDGGLCTRLLWAGGPPIELASASADVNGLTFSFTANGDGGTTATLWRIPLDGGVGDAVPGSVGNGTVAAAVLATNSSVFATTLIGVRPDLQSAFTQPPDAGAALTRYGQATTSVRFTALSNVVPRPLLPSHLSPLRTNVAGAEDVMVFSTFSDLVHFPPGIPFGGSGPPGVLWTAYRFESSGATRLGATAFSCLGNNSGLTVRGGVTLSDGGVCALISKSCLTDDVKVIDVDNPGTVTVLRRDAGAAPGGELIVCGPPVPPASSDAGVYTSRTVTLGQQPNLAMTAGAGALYVYRNGNIDRFLPGSMNSAAINAAPAGVVATPRGVFVVGSDRSLNQGYLEFLDPNMLRKLDEWRLSSTSDAGLNSMQLVAAAPNDDVWLVGIAAPGATLSSMDGGSLAIPSGVFAILLSP